MTRSFAFVLLTAFAAVIATGAALMVFHQERQKLDEHTPEGSGRDAKQDPDKVTPKQPDATNWTRANPKQHRPVPPPADAWPMFHGAPHLAGVAAGVLPEKPELLWSFKTDGPVVSSAAIFDGKVFVGSDDNNLYALNLADGKKVWVFKTDNEVGSSPCVANGIVYVGNMDGMLFAVDATTGIEKWHYKTEAKIPGSPIAVQVPAPKGTELRILVGSFDNRLHCLDESGKQLWEYNLGQPINGAPAVVDNRIYFGGCDGNLHSVDLATGDGSVRCEAGAPIPGSAAVFEKRAYFGQHTDRVIAADLEHGGLLWSYRDRNFAYFSTPAIADGKIFIGGEDKRLHALNVEDGKAVWTFSTQGRINGSPVVCGERVYFGSSDGRMYAVTLDDGKETWSYEIGQEIAASPAIAAGRLVIGSADGLVYCFGKK